MTENITPIRNAYRVRVMISGKPHGGYYATEEAAAEARDRIKAQAPTRSHKHKPGAEEHKRQVAALPPGTDYRRNIYRHKSGKGYQVQLTRSCGIINGKFWSGPTALADAVEARDRLEKLHPATR